MSEIREHPSGDMARTVAVAVAYGVAGRPREGLDLLQPVLLAGKGGVVTLYAVLAEQIAQDAWARRPDVCPLTFGDVYGEPYDASGLPLPIRLGYQFATAWANRDKNAAYALLDAAWRSDSVNLGARAIRDGMKTLYVHAVAATSVSMTEGGRAGE